MNTDTLAAEAIVTPHTPPPSDARSWAWRQVRTPRWIRTGARRLVSGLLLLAVLFALVPWQQTATGAGKVIAYVPSAREQSVEATISGRVVRWLVTEGQRVTEGTPLVELGDNDPDYTVRLERQRELAQVQAVAADAKVAAGQAKVAAARSQGDAMLTSADAKVMAAQDKVEAERQGIIAAEATASTAGLQRDRADALSDVGLRSVQELENQRLKAETATAYLAEARAKLRVAEAELRGALGDRDKAIAEAQGKVAVAESELQGARAELAAYEQKLVDADVKLSRQATQVLTAPMDAWVVGVQGGQGGEQVKPGDALLQLVPDTDDRAVALMLDGNDVSLLRPGQEVRLQFEGWPALQFAGWPSVAVGTFGGVVDFIDASDDGKGSFRVVVRPHADDDAWPDARWLRQGLRTKGWVMLSQVPIGYELWRQLNDFPPAVAPPSDGKDDKVGDPIEKSKAGKAWKPK